MTGLVGRCNVKKTEKKDFRTLSNIWMRRFFVILEPDQKNASFMNTENI